VAFAGPVWESHRDARWFYAPLEFRPAARGELLAKQLPGDSRIFRLEAEAALASASATPFALMEAGGGLATIIGQNVVAAPWLGDQTGATRSQSRACVAPITTAPPKTNGNGISR